MYKYKFIKIDLEYKAFTKKAMIKEDYHEVIETHAREGWRLVQIFAPPIKSFSPEADFYELIFERELPGNQVSGNFTIKEI